MDVLGLAFIIIILIIGFGYFFLFAKEKDVDTKEDILNTIYAQSILDTIANIDNGCSNLLNVIEDCFVGRDICGQESCELAKDSIKPILDKTLKESEKNYIFYVKKENDKKIQLNYGSCEGLEKLSPAYIFIPSDSSDIVMTLELCR